MIDQLHLFNPGDIDLLASFLDEADTGRAVARWFPNFVVEPRANAMTLLRTCLVLVDETRQVLVVFERTPMPEAWQVHILALPAARGGRAALFFDRALGWAFLTTRRASIFGVVAEGDERIQRFIQKMGMRPLFDHPDGWRVFQVTFEDWALHSPLLLALPCHPLKDDLSTRMAGLELLASQFHASHRCFPAMVADALGAVTARKGA